MTLLAATMVCPVGRELAAEQAVDPDETDPLRSGVSLQ
jgi:hypothetical protein